MLVIIWLFFFGLIIGSFINALVYRLGVKDPDIPAKEKHLPHKKLSSNQLSISKGRSVCIDCGYQLSYKDLIPVLSWVSLGGKCRYCKKKISWQYPLVELLTSALFAGSFVFWPQEIDGWVSLVVFILWLFILGGLIAISVYDIKWMLIPDKILRPLLVAAVASVLLQAVSADNPTMTIRSHVLGLLIVGGAFLLLYYGSQGRWIGGGDVKLVFLLGLYLGWIDILVALAVGFYGASIIIFPLILLKKVGRKQQIPFGPFLIAGMIVATLFSQQIIDVYNNWLIF